MYLTIEMHQFISRYIISMLYNDPIDDNKNMEGKSLKRTPW